MTVGMGCQIDRGIKCESETGGCQIDSGRGCQNDIHNILVDLLEDVLEDTAPRADTDTHPQAQSEKQEEQKQKLSAFTPVEIIPQRLMPIIARFLAETMRKTLQPQELKVLNALSDYTEERIHQEISIAVGRFRRMNRPLHSLLLNYIVESLRKKTLPQGDINLPSVSVNVSGYEQQEQEQLSEMSNWEYADTRKYSKGEVKELYEAGGWGNFEELAILCEICRLSEREISELYEELSVPAMKSA